jgi:hypothetical protein
MADTTSSKLPPADDAVPATGTASTPLDDAAPSKSMLSNHKTHLAIGVAATLGIMIFYNWREKRLAKKDPEGYARLQRLKASVRSGDIDPIHDGAGKHPEVADNVRRSDMEENLHSDEPSPETKPNIHSTLPQ